MRPVQANPFGTVEQPQYAAQPQPQTPYYPPVQQQQPVAQPPARRYAPPQDQLRMASRSPVAQKRDSMPAQMIERNRDSPSRFTEPKSASVRQGQKPTQDPSYSFGKNNRPAGRQNQSYTQPTNSKRGMGRPQVEMSPKSRKA
jgi:hypothetical protein